MATSANNPLRSILLVEDDRDYSSLLHQAFAEAGFRTLQAENGERALQLLRDEPVDLVVSDFIMPELNGLELCRLVHNDFRLSRAKVVLYSCNTDATFREKARQLGALDYIPKTDDAEELVRQICELAGIEKPQAVPDGSDGRSGQDELWRSVSSCATELKVLFDNLLDFVQIAALSDSPSPTVRMAWEAAQRNSGDIKRLLTELEAGIGKLRT